MGLSFTPMQRHPEASSCSLDGQRQLHHTRGRRAQDDGIIRIDDIVQLLKADGVLRFIVQLLKADNVQLLKAEGLSKAAPLI